MVSISKLGSVFFKCYFQILFHLKRIICPSIKEINLWWINVTPNKIWNNVCKCEYKYIKVFRYYSDNWGSSSKFHLKYTQKGKILFKLMFYLSLSKFWSPFGRVLFTRSKLGLICLLSGSYFWNLQAWLSTLIRRVVEIWCVNYLNKNIFRILLKTTNWWAEGNQDFSRYPPNLTDMEHLSQIIMTDKLGLNNVFPRVFKEKI